MGTWTTRARAAFLDAAEVSADKLADYDCVIAKAATGENYNPLFAGKHVQAAYDAGKPCIAFVDSMAEYYTGSIFGQFPKPDDDWHIKALDRALKMSSGAMRAVHGIMIDCSRVLKTDGQDLTPIWIAGVGRHLINMIFDRYHLPIYLYMNKNAFTKYKDDSQYESLVSLVNDYGISFPYTVPIANGFPIDTANPNKGSPYAGDEPWYFWGYGVVNGLYSFIYNGDKTALWKELNYKAAENNETPETPGNGDDGGEGQIPPSSDVAALSVRLDAIQALLEPMSENLRSIKAFIDGVKGL